MDENKFCKTFQSENYGQIVVINDEDSEGKPAVQVFVKPDGYGVCSIFIGFKSYDERDNCFYNAELKDDEDFAKVIFSMLNGNSA